MRCLRLLRTVLVVSAVSALMSAASTFSLSSSVAADAPSARGGCGTEAGVTVVVDFSDVGGTIRVGCAAGNPATGRTALSSAGFTPTDSTPGMICAIDATPDPCPATYQGTYWSYWHAIPGQAWVSYQVGADSSKPARGEVEGWRYNDGSAGPGITASAAASAAASGKTRSPTPAPSATTNVDGTLIVSVVAGAVLILLIIAAFVFVARRNAASRLPGLNDRSEHDESD